MSGLGETFSVSFPPSPSFSSLSQVKKFCSGLLDPSTRSDHFLWPAVRRCGLRARVSIAASVFLFRKTLPGSDPDLDAYVRLLGEPAPPPVEGFFEFARRELEGMFRPGWDRSWQSKVSGSTMSTSACLELPRSQGGPRGLAIREGFSRLDFLELCSGEVDLGEPSPVKVTKVVCDGKKRLVTVSPALYGVLSPLHALIYDHLSRFDWLLRGEATPGRFLPFRKVKGECFVSGDYESATDNLNLEVAEAILVFILRQCSFVPLEIREFAVKSLSADLLVGGSLKPHRRGQLMGSLLCFPLLCLQNYLAFRFFVRRRGVPVRINGDDIVFRARPDEYAVWSAGVGRIGLKLSPGKTSVSSSWFSLNSTFFFSSADSVTLIPVIRSTQWFSAIECPTAIAGRVAAFARGFPDRDKWVARLLRRIRPSVESSQRSLKRGLSVPVSVKVIKLSGLWLREVFYLSLPREPGLVAPRSAFAQNCIPEGWRRFPAKRSLPGDDFLSRVIATETALASWERPPLPPSAVSNALWSECRSGTSSFSSYLQGIRRGVRLHGEHVCSARCDRSCRSRGTLWRRLIAAMLTPSPDVVRLLSVGKTVPVWRPEDFGSRCPGVGA